MKQSAKIFIDRICAKLPLDQYVANEVVKYDGETLKLTGHDSKEIDREEDYAVPSVRYHLVNHKRRAKRAYKKRGKEGLFQYLKQHFKDEFHPELELMIRELC